jgi:hypothetical protein
MIGPLPTALGRFNRVLVAIDKFTKWIEVKSVTCPKADSVLDFLDEIVHRYGLPNRICRMDLPGPTTSVGTRTDYSVGPWDYPACATRHLKAWSTGTAEEKYSVRKLYMSCTVWKTPRRTRLVLSPYSDL